MKTHPTLIEFLKFLEATPTSYHTTAYISETLQNSNQKFEKLSLHESWKLAAGKHYFVERGGTVIAFSIPSKHPVKDAPFKIWAAHSDSPALKLKSLKHLKKENALIALSEPYGGILAPSWFNRDLHIAGRVFLEPPTSSRSPSTPPPITPPIAKLIHLKDITFTIPAPAIHFKTRDDKSTAPNTETELRIILGLNHQAATSSLIETLIKNHLKLPDATLLGWDLMFVSAEPPKLSGLENELILASQLDNSAMTDIGIQALLAATETNSFPHIPMVAIFDHEEVGSRTSEGAASTFMLQILERICYGLELTRDDFLKKLHPSFIISADMAHATHPNYPHLHSDLSRPLLGHGPVLKKNGHLRYISEGHGEAFVRKLATLAKVPLQTLTARSDFGTGATIGPLLASELGISSVDLGSPMLSMHSIRELAAAQDHLTMLELAKTFFTAPLIPPAV